MLRELGSVASVGLRGCLGGWVCFGRWVCLGRWVCFGRCRCLGRWVCLCLCRLLLRSACLVGGCPRRTGAKGRGRTALCTPAAFATIGSSALARDIALVRSSPNRADSWLRAARNSSAPASICRGSICRPEVCAWSRFTAADACEGDAFACLLRLVSRWLAAVSADGCVAVADSVAVAVAVSVAASVACCCGLLVWLVGVLAGRAQRAVGGRPSPLPPLIRMHEVVLRWRATSPLSDPHQIEPTLGFALQGTPPLRL
jgi:hypothetical protein